MRCARGVSVPAASWCLHGGAPPCPGRAHFHLRGGGSPCSAAPGKRARSTRSRSSVEQRPASQKRACSHGHGLRSQPTATISAARWRWCDGAGPAASACCWPATRPARLPLVMLRRDPARLDRARQLRAAGAEVTTIACDPDQRGLARAPSSTPRSSASPASTSWSATPGSSRSARSRRRSSAATRTRSKPWHSPSASRSPRSRSCSAPGQQQDRHDRVR